MRLTDRRSRRARGGLRGKATDCDVRVADDTTTGAVRQIPVGKELHGLTVWPQPGRYSLGHTWNMR